MIVQISCRCPNEKTQEIIDYCNKNGIKFNALYGQNDSIVPTLRVNSGGLFCYAGSDVESLKHYLTNKWD